MHMDSLRLPCTVCNAYSAQTLVLWTTRGHQHLSSTAVSAVLQAINFAYKPQSETLVVCGERFAQQALVVGVKYTTLWPSFRMLVNGYMFPLLSGLISLEEVSRA